MAKKRYISTRMSTDPKIAVLIEKGGDFAALLYTWMIPHIEEYCRINGTPEEIMLQVIPGRRDKTADDVMCAIVVIQDAGLITWHAQDRYLEFDMEYWDEQRTSNSLHHKWREAALLRDDYTCQICGEIDKTLHAHHIKHWAAYPDLRYVIGNGITLCVDCQSQFIGKDPKNEP